MTERYLPLWAKSEMADKDRRIRDLEARNAELEAAARGDGGSAWRYHSIGEMTRNAMPSSVRTMEVEVLDDFELAVTPDKTGGGSVGRKGWVEIMCISHHGIMVIPQASNVIHVGPQPRIR